MTKIRKLLFGILLTFLFTISVNASSANVSVSSSTSKTVVGNTFSVTIKISSGSTFGTWEFTPSYDTGKFKLVSGSKSVKSYGKKKSVSYTYKFKAINTGSGKITVKSIEVLDYETEKPMSLNIGSKTVTVITQKDLEASYSKDNYLKKLSIDGLTLSPTFKKDTLEYTAEAGANTTSINIKATKNDSKASVSGTGKKNVSEGENKFNITVKAQNGSTRTYKIIVNVTDPNPITVTVDNKEYTIVKRESVLNCPENFEPKKITINDVEVPAFYNETNKYTLVGLKNAEETALFIYDETNNTYKKYYPIDLQSLNILPLEIEKDFGDNYKEEELSINDTTIKALNLKETNYFIINARNLFTGKDNYYLYDKETGTAIRYKEAEKEVVNIYTEDNDKNNKYKNIILILAAVTTIMTFITLLSIFSKNKTKKDMKKLINKIKEEKELEERKKEELQNTSASKRKVRPKKNQE